MTGVALAALGLVLSAVETAIGAGIVFIGEAEEVAMSDSREERGRLASGDGEDSDWDVPLGPD